MISMLIKASLVIIVLLTFYKLFLEKENFFAANRIYLLSCLVFACTLPFIVLPKFVEHQGVVSTWFDTTSEPALSAASEAALQLEHLPPINKNISTDAEQVLSKHFPNLSHTDEGRQEAEKKVHSEKITTENETQLNATKQNSDLGILYTNTSSPLKKSSPIAYWLSLLYIFGVGVFLFNLFSQIIVTLWKVYRNEDRIEDKDGTIVNLNGNVEPCSFFKYIFINPEIYDHKTYEQIIAHEKIHVRKRHSYDLILSELAVALLWFNPIYMDAKKGSRKKYRIPNG